MKEVKLLVSPHAVKCIINTDATPNIGFIVSFWLKQNV